MLPNYKSILVPVDFSPVSKLVVAHAVSIARASDAAVCLMHAWEIPPPLRPDLTVWSGDFRASLEMQARDESARGLRDLLEDPDVARAHITTEIRHGSAYQQIIASAEAHRADLIVMGTHGRTGLSHLVMGSVAEKVVRHAACPVLTVRMPSAVEVGGASGALVAEASSNAT